MGKLSRQGRTASGAELPPYGLPGRNINKTEESL